jgi:hypothetical protein
MIKSHFYTAEFMTAVLFVLSSCLGPRTAVHIDESDVPDKTLSIIVETDMDNETAYRTIEQLLVKRGFTLRPGTELLDGVPDDLYVIAERVDADLIHVQMGIGIQGETDAEITIRGWYTALQYEGHPPDLEEQMIIIKEGVSGPVGREAWIEMFRLASEIGGIMRFEQ